MNKRMDYFDYLGSDKHKDDIEISNLVSENQEIIKRLEKTEIDAQKAIAVAKNNVETAKDKSEKMEAIHFLNGLRSMAYIIFGTKSTHW